MWPAIINQRTPGPQRQVPGVRGKGGEMKLVLTENEKVAAIIDRIEQYENIPAIIEFQEKYYDRGYYFANGD